MNTEEVKEAKRALAAARANETKAITATEKSAAKVEDYTRRLKQGDRSVTAEHLALAHDEHRWNELLVQAAREAVEPARNAHLYALAQDGAQRLLQRAPQLAPDGPHAEAIRAAEADVERAVKSLASAVDDANDELNQMYEEAQEAGLSRSKADPGMPLLVGVTGYKYDRKTHRKTLFVEGERVQALDVADVVTKGVNKALAGVGIEVDEKNGKR